MFKRLLVVIAGLWLWLGMGFINANALAQPALAPLPPQPDGVAWPTLAWPTGGPDGPTPAALAAAINAKVDASDPTLGETRAFLIVQGGRLVFERYGTGVTANQRHVSWSAAKSMTQALVGVAALQGKLDPRAPMGNPAWPAGQRFANVSWRQWLQMVDGQDWLEVGSRTLVENGSALALFGPGRLDVAGYCAARPKRAEPGARWNYNTCGITLVADALGRLVAPQGDAASRRASMTRWMRDGLFAPIGMTSVVPEFDAKGAFLGGSLIYATAQDFARFGYLYLRNGVWDGRRILPEGWVDFARSPQPATETDTYGAGWWITPSMGEGKGGRALIVGDGMRDAFSAQGRSGQVVLVVPSKDLVIVRLGAFVEDNADAWNALGDWLGAVARQFPDIREKRNPGPAGGSAAPRLR